MLEEWRELLKNLETTIRDRKAWNLFPDTFMCHYKVAEILRTFTELSDTSSILDIGGIGRLKWFLKGRITDANVIDGVDGCNLPYRSNQFDLCVSINTLEHVFDKDKLIQEALRTSKFGVVLCFPFDGSMIPVEDMKNSIEHYHPLSGPLPNVQHILSLFESFRVEIVYCMPNWLHIAFICGINRMTDKIKSYINHQIFDDNSWDSDASNACTVILKIEK